VNPIDAMELIVLPLFALVVAVCFSGMFAKHKRRRKRLARMSLDGAPREELAAFEKWRKAARLNSQYADAAAYCAALMWIFPFLFLGLLVLPFLANRQRRIANALQIALPDMPCGLKWLDAKELRLGPPEETTVTPNVRRPWAAVAAIAIGATAVAGGAIALVQMAMPDPKISGKPLSHWVEQVSDLDPVVRNMAIDKLHYAAPEHLQRHLDELTDAAKHNPRVERLLKEKFPVSD
jgi:hypothetical protein